MDDEKSQSARELGVAEEVAAVRARAEKHLERGEGFIKHGMWDDALTALAEAEALLPDDVRVLHAEARAHWGRYLHGSRGDGKAVRALAKRCLELQPDHEPSFTLLKQMDARPRWSRRRKTLAVVAGLLIVGGMAGVRSGQSRSVAGLCGKGESYCNVPVPVKWTGTGFDVTFAPAVLEVAGDSLRVNLSGRLIHRGATELDELRLTAHLEDETGKELAQLRLDAHPSFDPPLRSGDAAAFYLSEKAPPGTRRIEVSPGQVHATRAPELYGTTTPVEVRYDPPAPEHIVLRAAYRRRQARVFPDKTAVEGVLELENAGQGVVRELELELRALGPDGAPVGEPAKEIVAYGHMLPMAPGERRVVRFHLYVPGAVVGERLVVTKVD